MRGCGCTRVDPYLPEAERKAERRRIENAFRAVTALPGHPNILTVRDFFPNEDENRFVLVTEDVAGHALRQHITKASLSLTFDQKISIRARHAGRAQSRASQ